MEKSRQGGQAGYLTTLVTGESTSTRLGSVEGCDGASQETRRRRRSCWEWFTTWWLPEVLGILGSLLSQGAAIVILMRMENQPLTNWSFFISLNATIAIATTAAKSFMLLTVASCLDEWKWLHFSQKRRKVRDMDSFDWASRGPLGSLFFMFRMPLRIPAIGALVIVLALAVDTFAQQLISLDTVSVPSSNSSAALGLAQNYTSGAERALDGLASSYPYSTSIPHRCLPQ
jgi:hypothetical protein